MKKATLILVTMLALILVFVICRQLISTGLNLGKDGDAERCYGFSGDAATIRITSHSNGDFVPHSKAIVLTVDAWDDSGIEKVELLLNGVEEGGRRSIPYEWDLGLLDPGSHRLRLKGFANDGELVFTQVTINVLEVSIAAPTVDVTSFTDGEAVPHFQHVVVAVDASDDSGIEKAKLFLDGVEQWVDTEAPYEWDLGLLSLGMHTLKTTAVANDGGHTAKSIAIDVVEASPTHSAVVTISDRW